MGKFLNSRLKDLAPYDTSEEIESMKGYMRLNTNESPFELGPEISNSKAVEDSVKGMNFYPDPDCRALAKKLSELLEINPEQIIFGNGSDEILNFIFTGFCEKGAAFPDITYSFYKILAKFHGVDFLQVPLRDDFTINPEDYKNLNGRTIFITNPNAPTSLFLSLDLIEKIIAQNPEGLVIIDEAYIDFGGDSAIRLINSYKNLIVTRTFSKSRSMAGGRLGWAMTNYELAKDFRAVKNSLAPYNINAMTQAAALAILEHEEITQKNLEIIKTVRENTKATLREIGFEVFDSAANFLFVRHEKISGLKIFEELKQNRIMIRHFDHPERISDFNRITIGTPEQMQELLKALKKILKG